MVICYYKIPTILFNLILIIFILIIFINYILFIKLYNIYYEICIDYIICIITFEINFLCDTIIIIKKN